MFTVFIFALLSIQNRKKKRLHKYYHSNSKLCMIREIPFGLKLDNIIKEVMSDDGVFLLKTQT